MDEVRINKINELFDNMIHRLEVEIRQASAEDFEHIADVIITLFETKEDLQNSERAMMASEKLTKMVIDRLKGDGGIMSGPLPK